METTLIDNYNCLENNSHFTNENDLRNYIIANKESFCEEVLGVTYKRHIEEYRFLPVPSLHSNTVVVDIVIVDSDDRAHLIELKCPRFGYTECMQGVGQCLSYYYLARIHKIQLADVYLVTSKHSNLVPLIIRDNALNIKYIYYDKEKHATIYR